MKDIVRVDRLSKESYAPISENVVSGDAFHDAGINLNQHSTALSPRHINNSTASLFNDELATSYNGSAVKTGNQITKV